MSRVGSRVNRTKQATRNRNRGGSRNSDTTKFGSHTLISMNVTDFKADEEIFGKGLQVRTGDKTLSTLEDMRYRGRIGKNQIAELDMGGYTSATDGGFYNSIDKRKWKGLRNVGTLIFRSDIGNNTIEITSIHGYLSADRRGDKSFVMTLVTEERLNLKEADVRLKDGSYTDVYGQMSMEVYHPLIKGESKDNVTVSTRAAKTAEMINRTTPIYADHHEDELEALDTKYTGYELASNSDNSPNGYLDELIGSLQNANDSNQFGKYGSANHMAHTNGALFTNGVIKSLTRMTRDLEGLDPDVRISHENVIRKIPMEIISLFMKNEQVLTRKVVDERDMLEFQGLDEGGFKNHSKNGNGQYANVMRDVAVNMLDSAQKVGVIGTHMLLSNDRPDTRKLHWEDKDYRMWALFDATARLTSDIVLNSHGKEVNIQAHKIIADTIATNVLASKFGRRSGRGFTLTANLREDGIEMALVVYGEDDRGGDLRITTFYSIGLLQLLTIQLTTDGKGLENDLGTISEIVTELSHNERIYHTNKGGKRDRKSLEHKRIQESSGSDMISQLSRSNKNNRTTSKSRR